MKKILTFGLAASTLLVGSVQAQAATLIDNFDNKAVTLTVTAGDKTATMSQDSVDGVLGKERDIKIELDSEIGDANVRIDLVDSNLYAHNNEFNVSSTVDVGYDGFGEIDLSSLGNKFAIDVLDFEIAGSSSVGVSVVDTNNASDFQTFDITSLGTTTFDFADFDGVDLSAVTEIALQTKGLDAEDIALDNFRVEGEVTTPEPAAVVGLLLSLGCGALSKKKKDR